METNNIGNSRHSIATIWASVFQSNSKNGLIVKTVSTGAAFGFTLGKNLFRKKVHACLQSTINRLKGPNKLLLLLEDDMEVVRKANVS